MVLPSEGDREIVLTKEALSDPQPFIERIFAIELPNHIETSFSQREEQLFIREILCPQFNVFPTASFESDLKKIVFHRLLKEQAGILNYLDEQRIAVINGAAGTGKTMVAVEKAFRHAADNESVAADYVANGLYKGKYRFSTCRKFKGPEADMVVLVDINSDTFNTDNVLLYYVGTSRARIKLEMLTTLSDDDCLAILRGRFGSQAKIKRPKKELASVLNSIGSLEP